MNELTNVKTYDDLRIQLNTELNQAAISFVRAGYLLKIARDTDILKGSSYSNVNEFASAEFGLDKTQVSRFMRINDRFSINGYSEELEEKYRNYGSAKLSLMLTLPDEINEELSPEYSKSDIQAIKEEYEDEQKISDLEVMMEDKPDDEPDEFIALVVKHLNDEHPEAINTIHWGIGQGITVDLEDIKDAYMPDGDRAYSIRIPGQGRYMITCKDAEISIVNMRSPEEKSTLSWDEFMTATLEDEKTRDFNAKEPEKAEKPKKVEKSKPTKKAEPKEKPKTANESEEDTEQQAKIEETKETASEEIRKLKRIASDLRALADQFDAGTGGNLYSNPIEELEGMIDEINSLPGQLIPIIEEAIRRKPPKEED